jgi:hypothetical protein
MNMNRFKNHFKNQIGGWVKGQIQTAQATWLNRESLLHGLKWLEVAPGQVRLQVAPQWLGRTPSKYTGSLILACEMAVEEALAREERMNGVALLFMGSQSEFLRAQRGPCEIRFRMQLDEIEQLRLSVLKEKTFSRDFFLTLWSQDEVQVGSVTLQVRLQLQTYLTS